MIGKTVRPASLFAFAFFKEVAALSDPMLDAVDGLLEDPKLLALSTEALVAARQARTKLVAKGLLRIGCCAA